jgi:hypothetical protein
MKSFIKSLKKYEIIIFIISIIVLAITFTNVSQDFPFLKNFFQTLSTSFLVTIIVSTLARYENIKSNEILESANEYGLYGVYKDFPLNIKEIEEDFVKSKNVYINMNDGKNFISSNSNIIKKRLSQKKLTTTFIICDYNNNEIMKLLDNKNSHKPGYYKDKIKELIRYQFQTNYVKLCKDKEHNLLLRLNKSYNMLSIILTDNYALYSIYRVSKMRKTTVPHFVFRKGSKEFEEIKNDIDELCKENNSNEFNFNDID